MKADKNRLKRARTVADLYSKKFVPLPVPEKWIPLLGAPSLGFNILVYGNDKNGKTAVSLMLANDLSALNRVLYISAEEGERKTFVDALKRAGIEARNRKLHAVDYIDLEELKERLRRRNAPRVVVIDNITVYDELKGGGLRSLFREFPQTSFMFLAHEDKKEPYGATAKMAKKLVDAIFHVEGLVCTVTGRCPGGKIIINEGKAKLHHGNNLLNN